jgi:hypothetical protein
VAQSVKSSVRIDNNLITGKLFPETLHLGFKHPGLEFLVRMLGLAEDMASLGLSNEVFEDEFRFLVDLEHALRARRLSPRLMTRSPQFPSSSQVAVTSWPALDGAIHRHQRRLQPGKETAGDLSLLSATRQLSITVNAERDRGVS